MSDKPEIDRMLAEIDAMRQITELLAPLSPRMRAAILAFAREWLADRDERAAAAKPERP